MNRLVRLLVLLSGSALLAACAVGPDFKEPKPPSVRNYTSRPLSSTAAAVGVSQGEAQHFVSGADIPGAWWQLFHSTALDTLVERALKKNPDLKAAEAALLVARENVLAQNGAYYPSITANISTARQKTSAALSPTPNSGALYFGLYTPQVNVTYMPDVFGLNRRTVEGLVSKAKQTRYALAAARITLAANVATAAVQEASLQAQIGATHRLIALNDETLNVFRHQYVKGYASRLDVAAQASQLAQITATLPPLLKQLAQQRDLLLALTGSFPDENPPGEIRLSGIQLPDNIPISIPSLLVAHRPDVLQAMENLHAASAAIGIAIANRLPNITLTADMGSAALTPGRLFSSGTSMWDLGANLAQPIFEGGALLHNEQAARAAFAQAKEEYRSTVAAAFQNVADTLNALQQDADELKSAAAAEQAARIALELTKRQMQAGYTNNLALSNAEIAYQQAIINLIQARMSRLSDTVALFQALGGGWWNRREVAAVETSAIQSGKPQQ